MNHSQCLLNINRSQSFAENQSPTIPTEHESLTMPTEEESLTMFAERKLLTNISCPQYLFNMNHSQCLQIVNWLRITINVLVSLSFSSRVVKSIFSGRIILLCRISSLV